jgi:hypothetical protein
MKRVLLTITLGLLASLCFGGVALAVEKPDQENAGPIASVYDHEEFDSALQYVAQVFTPGMTGELSKVFVLIEKETCGAGTLDPLYTDINVRIYSIGTYSWTLKASTTIPASQVPYRPCWPSTPPPQWTDVTFDPDNRPQVYARSRYAIALEPGSVSSGSGDPPSYHWYYNGGGGHYYTGGDGYYRRHDINQNLTQIGALDFLFMMYVDVPDTDGDGITDDVDQCDTESGPASNNGCPVAPDTVSPTGSVEINRDARITRSRTVKVALRATDLSPGTGVVSMRVKNAGGGWTAWQPCAKRKDWKLTARRGQEDGLRQV